MDISPKSQDSLSLPLGYDPLKQETEATIELASQWKLMWWKFRRHRLAVIGLIVVITFYVVALFADFFAPQSPSTYIAEYVYAPPQQVVFFHDGTFAPFVYGYKFERDPRSFKKIFSLDEEVLIPIGFFVHGESYKFLGLIESDIHLMGPLESGQPFY